MKQRLMKDLKEAMKSTDINKKIKLMSIKAVKQTITDYEKSNPNKAITDETLATFSR